MKKLIMAGLFVMALSACGKDGAQGQQGLAGMNGIDGIAGAVGATGAQGIQGAQGPAGANGTVITPVEFCPGVTPVYPSVFPEYGLCINDQLYGVYSANDGFMALLPPGAYTSNAVGSACNFTIAAHCSVTQN